MYKSFLSFFAATALLFASCGDAGSSDPEPEEAPEKEVEAVRTLKVMSYNIHHCNPPSEPNLLDVDAIQRVIRSESPDLVALQEVDVHTRRSGNVNQAQQLASKLGMRYYFAKAIDYQGGEYGVAILSKYPLLETVTHRLPTISGSGGEARVLATAKITLPDGQILRFGSTHLDAQADPANRKLQVEEINRLASSEQLPFIIAGDFNAVPNAEEIKKLDEVFTRTCQVCPPTMSATNPTRAIDFIVYRHPASKFNVGSHKVVHETYASDHRPVVALINILK